MIGSFSPVIRLRLSEDDFSCGLDLQRLAWDIPILSGQVRPWMLYIWLPTRELQKAM